VTCYSVSPRPDSLTLVVSMPVFCGLIREQGILAR